MSVSDAYNFGSTVHQIDTSGVVGESLWDAWSSISILSPLVKNSVKIPILQYKQAKIPMLRHFTVTLLICAVLASSASNADDFFSNFANEYVGAWQGKMTGVPIEIVLWETGQRTALIGIVRTLDGDCALSLKT